MLTVLTTCETIWITLPSVHPAQTESRDISDVLVPINSTEQTSRLQFNSYNSRRVVAGASSPPQFTRIWYLMLPQIFDKAKLTYVSERTVERHSLENPTVPHMSCATELTTHHLFIPTPSQENPFRDCPTKSRSRASMPPPKSARTRTWYIDTT